MNDREGSLMLTVLVPVHQESDGLGEVHDAVVGELQRMQRSFEIVYLTDRAHPEVPVLRKLRQADPDRVRVLEFEHEVGESAMLRAGLDVARGELLLTVPAPLEVEAAAIGALCEQVDVGADLAVATRMAFESGRAAVAQSRLFNRLITLAAGVRIRDVASSTRVLRREVLAEIPLYGEFHRYLPLLAHRTGFRIVEVDAAPNPKRRRRPIHPPTTYLFRLIDLLNVFFISRFTRRPLRLFGSLGIAFLALGVPILGVVGVERLLGVPLGNRPILVLGTLLIGLGVQAITVGLLGELLLFFNASSFRDYRIAEICEPETPLPESPDAALTSESGAPLRGAPGAHPPRKSDTRSPR